MKGDYYHYELVEIPIALLNETVNGSLYIMNNSKQTPQPGYCDVRDLDGAIKFRLYFDGGSERKLQIKDLQIKYCLIHANWVLEK
jgi:type II restriction enzyme